jgi:hypothetical protein
VPLTLVSPLGVVLRSPGHHLLFSLLLKPNGTIYFSYLGTQMDTLSTSVLNDPTFTTHDYLSTLTVKSVF